MINERKLTPSELAKREDIIQNMKKNKRQLVKRYGKDAEQVMYGSATKKAKQTAETMNPDKIRETIKSVLSQPPKVDEGLPKGFWDKQMKAKDEEVDEGIRIISPKEVAGVMGDAIQNLVKQIEDEFGIDHKSALEALKAATGTLREGYEEDNKEAELEAAKDEARENSKEGYAQHVNKTPGGYKVEDWFDSDTTVASFMNGEYLEEGVDSDSDFNVNKVWDFIGSRPFNNPNYSPMFSTAQELWDEWDDESKQKYRDFKWEDKYGDKVHPKEKANLDRIAMMNGGLEEEIDESYETLVKKITGQGKSEKVAKAIAGAVASYKAKGGGKGPTSLQKKKLTEKVDLPCNKPKRTPQHKTKSHVVKACEDGKEKTIRFGQQGVKGSPKKKDESKAEAARRKAFKARHAKNIKKGKMSAAYWANKVKW